MLFWPGYKFPEQQEKIKEIGVFFDARSSR